MPPLSLSMLKMEKNFVAVIDKGYPRKPYEEYPILNPKNSVHSLIGFVTREKRELDQAIDRLKVKQLNYYRGFEGTRREISDNLIAAMNEVADVSNTLDYLFEGLLNAYTELEDEIE